MRKGTFQALADHQMDGFIAAERTLWKLEARAKGRKNGVSEHVKSLFDNVL